MKTIMLHIQIVTLLLITCFEVYSQNSDFDTKNNSNINSFYKIANELRYENPEKAADIFYECIEISKTNKDTFMHVRCLLDLNYLYLEKLDYTSAFKTSNEAFALAQQINSPDLLAESNRALSIIFNVFNQKEKSLHHRYQALNIIKAAVASGIMNKDRLISAYFDLITISYRFEGESVSKKYLDTCFMLTDTASATLTNYGYLLSEKGNFHRRAGEYEEAEKALLKTKYIFEENTKSGGSSIDNGYLVFIYAHLGDLYRETGNYQKSVSYYKLSLQTIDRFGIHELSRMDINYYLSQTYSSLNEFNKAYNALLKSRDQADKVFGANSNRNQKLFEIQSQYQKKLELKNKEIALRDIELLKKNELIFRVKISAAVFVLVLIMIGLIYRNKIQRNKHLKKQAESKERLTTRNKELTSYTLQFIEKESLIKELVTCIKKEVPDKKPYQSLIKKAGKGNRKYWDEFNTRFVNVNQDFYKKLQSQFPNLSQSDLKVCALIKLNFSNKEASDILGISASSVKMARYRLKKKLALNKDQNLEAFISGV